MAVDQSHPGFDRVDAQAGVDDVEERHGRHDGARDSVVAEQSAHGSFEDQRGAGHGVQDLSVFGGRGDEALGDLGVHICEGLRRLVDIVERGCLTDQ